MQSSRKEVYVQYELNVIDDKGEEIVYEFAHKFDSELYYDDMEAMDLTIVNFKMQELKEKHGDSLFLDGFTIDRGGVIH